MPTYIDPTRDQFKAIATSNIEGKLSMLNLLKFKEKSGDISGAEQYKLYMAAAAPFFEKANAKVVFYGKPIASFIGPTGSEWDKVLIVEYADKSDFIKMLTAEGYPAGMRAKAIEDSRLIVCK